MPAMMVFVGGALTVYSADHAYLVTFLGGIAIAGGGGWWGLRVLRRAAD